MKIIKVDEKYNNKKVIDFLLSSFDGLSSSTAFKALRKKDIRINGVKISENVIVKAGDEVKVYIVDDLLEKKQSISKVYEDDNIVVFDKPSGMETTGEKSLTSYVKNLYAGFFVEPCHRLDRNTSGLVLFAKNKTSEDILLNAFKNHSVEKHYICITVGIPKKKTDKLKAYLFKDSKKSQVYISDAPKAGYREIITSYRVLKSNNEKNISLLDVTLETGRTHQIRAHMAHIGYPILGDGKYGINSINKQFRKNVQCLTSYSLSFTDLENTNLKYLNNKVIKLDFLPYDNLI